MQVKNVNGHGLDGTSRGRHAGTGRLQRSAYVLMWPEQPDPVATGNGNPWSFIAALKARVALSPSSIG
jgi:hypothetical protein